jgi:hypothetical protein
MVKTMEEIFFFRRQGQTVCIADELFANEEGLPVCAFVYSLVKVNILFYLTAIDY